ncbi:MULTISPECIES: ABC transporter substrate-binding protein [Halorubrum]|uniref:Spermidine/putrescine transport system substrate-binding protein n=1 Tax=Halorubrum sodomense TaxID=35743 RepID=A0A1I6I3Q1_HALSD|nr:MULTISPECIES: PotD/PotF family extracellular solute-binding protein [Halorubrum]TKX68544.1 extracellular solute-binding protein [Halorubrum sp. SP9]SFR61254.1 spermidine/putrescine transport system substrate-binding protein [Halorubrum sodomense]
MPTSHEDSARSNRSVSRRQYIAGAGAAGAVALAGCSGGGGGGSGGGGGNGSNGGSMGGDGTTTINIITWEEYAEMQENIESTLDGVELNITPSTSSTEMFSQWSAGQDAQYDIAVPNNNLVPRFMDAGLVAPVNRDVVTNFDSMYDRFQTFVDEQFTEGGDAYGVPIRFGWYGYSYDSRSVPDHEPSYNILFEEDYVDADLDGEIIMYNEAAKTIPAAALYLGMDDAMSGARMTFTEEQLTEIQEVLIDQKSRLQGYIAPDPTFIQEFRQGNFLVGHSGRNETVQMRSEGDDWVEFVAPREGALAWYETAVVSAASDNQETAWEVVNEFITPENGAALAEAGFSPSTNPNVADELTEEQNELYGRIDPSRLEGMYSLKDIASDVEEAYLSTWEEVKAA